MNVGVGGVVGRKTKIIGIVALAALALIGGAGLASWCAVRASLPRLDGEERWSLLEASIRIERDAFGAPRLTAVTRLDLARALGFVHAQDRFFQMDLLRRAAAGELAELLGESLVETDQEFRVHRFRSIAGAVLTSLEPAERALLEAYAQGVNRGLASLRARPPEYFLLRAQPAPWRPVDSLLCVYAMFLQLQDARGHYVEQRGLLREALPASLSRFLEAGAPEWDAAMDSSRSTEPQWPTDINLRAEAEGDPQPPNHLLQEIAKIGSNSWAIGGMHTANGAALVANDMHLGFRVPNIWYRVDMRMSPPERSASLHLAGVSLPGNPLIVAGTNGHIAWGFTNSYGDYEQLIRLVPVPGENELYATSDGIQRLRRIDERIAVHASATRIRHVVQSQWGPVIGTDWRGRSLVLDWTAHHVEAVNLHLGQLEAARSVDEALAIAPLVGIPGQNFTVGDAAGHIGWTIAGRLPARGALDTSVPVPSNARNVGIMGWQRPEDYPRIADPASGIIWTANARVVGGAGASAIGDGGYDRGARAAQIRDDLAAAGRFSLRDSLRTQLDDRALFLERWRVLMRRSMALAGAKQIPEAEAARSVLASWSGHAAPRDAAYRLVQAFRAQVEVRVFYMLVARARRIAPQFEFEIPAAFEGPLWRLLEARPTNLLAARYADWDALLLEAVQSALLLPAQCSDLMACTWGQVNEVHIAHPLSRAVPALSAWLDMPAMMLAGGRADMPRVQGKNFGASERFSVSVGPEMHGYFQMPGGQSGHFLSEYYRIGLEDWARGWAAPFLPGASTHELTISPR